MRPEQETEVYMTDKENERNNNINTLTNSNGNKITFPSTSDLINYIQNTPLFVKITSIFSIFFLLLHLFLPDFTIFLMNIPAFTIIRFRLWNIFVSYLVTVQIQNLLYAFIIWIPEARTLESSLGTIRYTINFMINNIIIQFLFIISSFIFAIFSIDFLYAHTCGIIPVMFSEITILSLANPNNLVTFIHIPIQFKAFYYPFIVYIVFLVINLKFYLDGLIGLIYGILFFYCFRPYFVLSDDYIQKLVEYFPLKYMKLIPGFVDLPKVKFSFSTLNKNESIDKVTVPNSPSKSLDLELNNSSNSSKVERQNVSIEKLDISQDNKIEPKTKNSNKL